MDDSELSVGNNFSKVDDSNIYGTSNNTLWWWPTLCGNESEDDAFWSDSLSISTYTPDLTRCFQNTVLTWTPCFCLWLSSLFWIPMLLHRRTVVPRFFAGRFNLIKLIFGIALSFISLIDLIRAITDYSSGTVKTAVLIIKYFLVLCSMVLASCLIRLEFRKGILSSGVMFCYWVLFAILYLVPFRSNILHITYTSEGVAVISDQFHFVTFYIAYALILTQFVLHLFADNEVATTDHRSEVKHSFTEERSLLSTEAGDVKPDNKLDEKRSDKTLSDDAKNDKGKNECPEIRASFLSRITFSWITRLIFTGYKRQLVFEDLWKLRPDDSCDKLMPQFEVEWKKELVKHNENLIANANQLAEPVVIHRSSSNGSVKILDGDAASGTAALNNAASSKSTSAQQSPASVWKAVTRVFGCHYPVAGVYKLLYDIITFINPILLNKLISFVGTATVERDEYVWHGYVYVLAMFIVASLRTVLLQQYWHVCFYTGQQLRSTMVGVVYRKSLRLSSSARRTTTVGEIVNLMSVDAQKFQDAPAYMHMLWSTPLTIALAMYLLWQLMGPSVIAGLVAMILLVPVNAYVANKSKSLQVRQMKHKDSRIKLMNEILNGIKVLKLYSWEESFKANILQIREKELKVLKESLYLNAFSAVSWFMAPYLVALGTFAVFVLSSPDNILDANKAFVSLSLFNILNYPLSILPIVITYGVQSAVSMKRIIRFLLNDELDENNVDRSSDNDVAIKLDDVTASWGKMDPPVVSNLNMSIPEGTLVGVVGQVGAGKSSLIATLCGETDVLKGKISVKGSVAFVPQQAWIQNATIRDNVLFNEDFGQTKYDNILNACALLPDLRILPGGDQTEVGEKGINLSGGQKQRISLARAVYQNADIYLLDDPLSAVDSHVGKHIFQHVIGPTGILSKKTRILNTNSVTFLPKMDLIIVLRNGEVSEMGTYNDLLSHKGAFSEFISTYLLPDSDTTDPEVVELTRQISRQLSIISSTADKDDIEQRGSTDSLNAASLTSQTESANSVVKRSKSRVNKQLSVKDEPQKPKTENRGRRLVEEEVAMTGNVKLSVFMNYLRACRFLPVVFTVLWYIMYLASQIGTNVWLSLWSTDPPPYNSSMEDLGLRDLRLGVYGGLGIVQALSVFGMAFGCAITAVNSSRLLHFNLLSSVFRAPMSFFDTTPLGRIINRLSRDVDTVDVNIPMTLRIWLGTFSGVITTIVVIAYSTPIFLSVVLPLGLLYYFVQRFYISTSRQLRRIDSIVRSPIYVHFAETVSGISSIRAYRRQTHFISQSDLLTDRNQMVNYAIISSNRWMGLWLETIGNLIVVFAGIFAVVQRETINAGLVGLSVSYALQVTGALNMVVRMTSDMESYIVSVERIQEYVDCPKEAAATIQDNRPKKEWPDTGLVQFKNYSVKYRPDLDLVLNDVSFEIKAGEKVGIVGRTGAGKSSLTLALFRIIEAVSGSIFVDGTDIASIGLDDLRSKLTIIPQDPVVFSGSLRMNLDPFNRHSDDEVWNALGQAHLESFVRGLPGLLEFVCSEGGDNLSVGQRQLVCLARALLRKTKILVLDEATASVDLETDDLIQTTIRTTFNDSTVITIAHRLNTIMDYDRVLVLDKSRVAEFDTPAALLQRQESLFYSLAKTAGLAQ